MTTASEVIEYSEIPARAKKVLEGFLPPEEKIAARVAELGEVPPRPFDREGDQEVLDGVTFTHHFVDPPGDEETVRFHYVETGQGAAHRFPARNSRLVVSVASPDGRLVDNAPLYRV